MLTPRAPFVPLLLSSSPVLHWPTVPALHYECAILWHVPLPHLRRWCSARHGKRCGGPGHAFLDMPTEGPLPHLTLQAMRQSVLKNQASKASKQRAGAVFGGVVRLVARWRNCMNQHRHSMDQDGPGTIGCSMKGLVGVQRSSMRRGHQTELECGSEFCRFRARGTRVPFWLASHSNLSQTQC